MRNIDIRPQNIPVSGVSSEVERARGCYERREWQTAYEAFQCLDQRNVLSPEDLEKFALSAYLTGRDDEYLSVLDRAHRGYLDNKDCLRASRCAFWCGLRLMLRGEVGPANGWLARAERLLERQERECVERGYLLIPLIQQHLDAGECNVAMTVATRASEMGERFADADLVAIARHLIGRALIEQGQSAQGLVLLDEVMLSVTSGELSPLVTGLIYCSVIEGCQQVFAFGRAREWTEALARWCAEQPELVAFTGVCLVHRAEVMQIQGAWQDALAEAYRACERCRQMGNKRAVAGGLYQVAELHRLHGDYAAAEEAYRAASELGFEPQPGFALLRLAQGNIEAAGNALRRIIAVTQEPLQRVRLLPAYVEVMLALHDVEGAQQACEELARAAKDFGTSTPGALDAFTAYTRGAVALAEDNPMAAIVSLRDAWRVWQQIGAPYWAARTRVLIGLACRALQDEEGSRLEFDAARAMFTELGATPELDNLRHLVGTESPSHGHGLTSRELQVLRLVATGKKNKVIAAELFVSERTIDRHVSSILDKLNVGSRAAATAYAYEHALI